MTKEGCGRVCFYKEFGLIHSYTLECGFHTSTFVNQIPPAAFTHRKYNGAGFEEDEIDNPNSDLYKLGPPLYTTQIYQNIGKNLLVSILDLFDKNPYPRIANS